MKSRSAFTLLDLLVVILVVTFVLCVVLPLLPRQGDELAPRVQCASQLRGLGVALAMYQNDFNNHSPIVWQDPNNAGHFGMGLYNPTDAVVNTRWANPNFNAWDEEPTVGGCLFLLIKYEEVAPKMFVCPSAPDDEELSMRDTENFCSKNGLPVPADYTKLNDFPSLRNLSYSYNDPWTNPLTGSASSTTAVLADKNWAYDSPTGVPNPLAGDAPVPNKNGSWHDAKGKNSRHGNSRNHQTECQNILFAGNNVSREAMPNVGLARDNIYTRWTDPEPSTEEAIEIGRWDGGHSAGKGDSYLGN